MERKDLQEEFEELMSLFLYGEISPKENERLNEIIDLDPTFKIRYETYVKIQDGLKTHKSGLKEILFESEETSSQSLSKKVFDLNKFRNPIFAWAAVIALIISVSLIFKQNEFRKEEKLPLTFGGNCDEKSVRTDWILTDANSFCDVEIAGEQGLIQFRIFPNSEARVIDLAHSVTDARNRGYRLSILIQKGNLLLSEFVRDPHSKTNLYVNGTAIQLTGTKILIEISEERNKISVWEGSARIRSGLRYLFPVLLYAYGKESGQNTTTSNAQNGVDHRFEIETQTDWKDLSSETISDHSLEIKTVNLSEKQKENLLKTLNGNRSIGSYAPEIQSSLKEIQTKISENLAQTKKIELKPENIQTLESIVEKFGDSTSFEFPKPNDETATPEKKVPKTETIKPEHSQKQPDNKIETPKEEPVRLGIKTITLKDGTVLKGNVIQYENQYVLEENGKKRIIKSSDIESISF
ncbi:transcriptional regulator [Leptospira barantonii]|uniref:Transcriptional regulator n=1 Tax=Leptospira barantonii TaxID=2023184 RepID=A0A5F2BD51_9LEPT|nr:transcriptional regulator [Leptospira barantonii]TGM03514.1 transcriptional regulator [Leptospira barantonii]